MSVLYTTMHNFQVDLETLTPEQKQLLKECFELYLANCSWEVFINKVYNPESMRIAGHELDNGQYWITAETSCSAISRVLEDLEDEINVRCGKSRRGNMEPLSKNNEEILRNFLK